MSIVTGRAGSLCAALAVVIPALALPACSGSEQSDSAPPDEAMEEAMMDPGRNDLALVLQAVLDHPHLQPYYHVEELPERKPLIVMRSDALAAEPPLRKFGVAVEYREPAELEGADLPYLTFTRVEIREDRAEVGFFYPPEGVRGEARLHERDGWQVESFDIWEE